MPGKRKPPPLSFTALACQFAPETRNLTAGKATRYIGGKAALTLSGGASEIVCLMRRKPGGAKWGKRPYKPHPVEGGLILINQTPANYQSGANYELTANKLNDGECQASTKAAIDFPPGSESLGRCGTELIQAFPLVRTESAILLWVRADTGIRKAAIDARAKVKGKRRVWRMRQPTLGPCAYLLIDKLTPGAARAD